MPMIRAQELIAASKPFTYSVMTHGPKPKTQCITKGCREQKYTSPNGKMNSYCPACRNKIERERARAKKAKRKV